MPRLHPLRLALALTVLPAVAQPPGTVKPTIAHTTTLNAYADSGCAIFINGELVAIDAIDFLPHNQISSNILPEYPMTIAVLAKDNAEPATGLEYGNKIGDAGFILKLGDGAVTNANGKAKGFFKGPLNSNLTNPTVERTPLSARWYATDFDDSAWGNATEYTAEHGSPPIAKTVRTLDLSVPLAFSRRCGSSFAVPPADPDTARWFAANIQQHAAALRAWLVHGFGARLAVDDVIQEAFLRVLRAREKGELKAPKAFLFAIARNLALDQLRGHAISRTDSLVEADLSNVLDDHASIPETVAREQERALLTEAVQSLPERCRQVMTLRLVYSLTQREIGARLGISDRTVAAQLAIGTARCTEQLLRRVDSRTTPR